MAELKTAASLGLAMVLAMSTATAQGETIISKSTTYFSISGTTAEDIDRELSRRGPFSDTTGMHHPGATRIKFGGTVTYEQNDGRCRVAKARVTLSTKIILPKWSNRKRARGNLGLIWDTLASDIKRHEERHAEIARNHARDLERTLTSLGSASDCTALRDRVAELSARQVEAHNAEQRKFDKVESINFERRIRRLLTYRMQKEP